MRFWYTVGTVPPILAPVLSASQDHPLSTRGMARIQQQVARAVGQLLGGQIVPPERVTILSTVELPQDVAADRFPQYFTRPALDPAKDPDGAFE